jgi:PIN domain nuclease of toxin-antitoxin system
VKAILDTHALIWVAENDPRLSQTALDFINDCARNELGICDISLLEIAMLHHKERIPSKTPLGRILGQAEMNFNVLRLNSNIAAATYALPLIQADPFDRVIVATAKHHQLPLITKDRLIIESNCVETIW